MFISSMAKERKDVNTLKEYLWLMHCQFPIGFTVWNNIESLASMCRFTLPQLKVALKNANDFVVADTINGSIMYRISDIALMELEVKNVFEAV